MLRVRVLLNEAPMDSAYVRVQLRMRRKNDFHSIHGPADGGGSLDITSDEIMLEAERNKALFLMDYGHPQLDWNGEIVLRPLSLKDLNAALEAYTMFSSVTQYPPGYKDRLEHSKQILERSVDGMLRVELLEASASPATIVLEKVAKS
jgi:hypothetical protein